MSASFDWVSALQNFRPDYALFQVMFVLFLICIILCLLQVSIGSLVAAYLH